MIAPEKAYNSWAQQYDSNENKTRDLEAISLRSTLAEKSFKKCLEIGCGTGKNTEWLVTKCESVFAVDLSEEMLSKARSKVQSERVSFLRADFMKYNFVAGPFDLVVFSLVLEHIEDLNFVFKHVSELVKPGGTVYIGELHPSRQYKGVKASFETQEGLQIVSCFTHHISDFIQPAIKFGFEIKTINEYFDNDDRKTIPRILTLVIRKK
jgi:2-polyprenyl-3-methyl-5-hydroxy-6-metoxy-1,4-benzoquinol methylase